MPNIIAKTPHPPHRNSHGTFLPLFCQPFIHSTAYLQAFPTFANVVGYQNKGLRQQFNYIVNTLRPVDKAKTEMTLGDIVPNESFIDSSIQLLQANGATATMNVYDSEGELVYEDVDAQFFYGEGVDGLGWYELEDWFNDGGLYNQNGFVLPFGQSYCVDRVDIEVDAAIVFSGEVEKAPFTANLVRAQFNYIGNCAPAKITLGDLVVNSKFVDSSIQLLQANGATATMNVYDADGEVVYEDVDAQFFYGEGADGIGWYELEDWFNDGGLYNQNGFELDAGDGFCVDRVDIEEGASIEIPSAHPDAE